MADVESDVSGPILASAKMMEASAAKEATMKDGEPEGSDKEGTKTKTALDKYNDGIKKAWADYKIHGDKVLLGLHVGKTVAAAVLAGVPTAIDGLKALAALKGK